MHDYNQRPLAIGDSIRNIENNWHGQIMSTQGEGPELLLVCQGINWWDGSLDDDDTQWHSPYDVAKADRQPDRSLPPNPLNLL